MKNPFQFLKRKKTPHTQEAEDFHRLKRRPAAGVRMSASQTPALREEFRWDVLAARKKRREIQRIMFVGLILLMGAGAVVFFREPLTAALTWTWIKAARRPAAVAPAGRNFPPALLMRKDMYEALLATREHVDFNTRLRVRFKQIGLWRFNRASAEAGDPAVEERRARDAMKKILETNHVPSPPGHIIRLTNTRGKMIDCTLRHTAPDSIEVEHEGENRTFSLTTLAARDRLTYDPAYREEWIALMSRAAALSARGLYLGLPLDENAPDDTVRRRAGEGHAEAQARYAGMLMKGHEEETDIARAFLYAYASALQGHPDGQYLLGSLYQRGLGADKNISAALYWFIQAAEQGHRKIIQYMEAFDQTEFSFKQSREAVEERILKARLARLEWIGRMMRGETVDPLIAYRHPF